MNTLKTLVLAFATTGALGLAPAMAESRGVATELFRPDAHFNTEDVETAVVWIEVRTYNDPRHTSWHSVTGTGVLIDGKRILTAKHVLDGYFDEIYIGFGGNAGHAGQMILWNDRPKEIKKWDTIDLAMLSQVEAPKWAKPVKIAKSAPAVSELAMSYGRPDLGGMRIRIGKLTDLQSPSGAMHFDFNSSKGDSGGPTFNGQMELIGIHSGTLETTTWSSYGGKSFKQTSYSVPVTNIRL